MTDGEPRRLNAAVAIKAVASIPKQDTKMLKEFDSQTE